MSRVYNRRIVVATRLAEVPTQFPSPRSEDYPMKLAVALISLALAAGTAFAEEKKADAPKKEPTAAQKAQQEKMKGCNAQAADKKGDERKAFMKQCLSGGNAADDGCAAKAVDKNGKPLAGAAKSSFVKKCQADSAAAK
mgnify:FL=1